MIVLDTHIWVWWIHNDERLNGKLREYLLTNEESGLGVSVFSCWEVAKLVQVNRLALHCLISEWVNTALNYPGIELLDLIPEIAVGSTRLPGEFHRDPADQIIVATARIHDIPLLTMDNKILDYPHVILLR